MQVTFLIDPWLKPIGDGDEWELVDHFTVRVEEPGKPTEIITVPRGFTTDLASVPRLPGAYLVFGGKARRSAILHDYLYTERRDRTWADAVFFAAMKNEVSAWRRYLMWAAVRVGGGAYYQSHQQAAPAEGNAP
ncbi:MAG: DUF1353 domain-containing protein [Acidovorax sp.]|uniref:DUF1353 domain-containing protein n=1 Tax=Acidovorax sp. TaxID=1872122 RepID=UPI003919E46B